jgi:hypothetical protein
MPSPLHNKFLSALVVGIVLVGGAAAFLHCRAQTVRRGNIKTDLKAYVEPPPPVLPRAGGKFIDPTFGTEIMRVTDERSGGNCGTSYAYWPTFNSNNTRILVQCEGVTSGEIYDFDPASFSLGTRHSIPTERVLLRGEDAIWSVRDPDILFAHADLGTTLWAFNVATGALRRIGDLGGRLKPGQYLFQMSKSEDDDVFAFTRRGPAPAYPYLGYLVYRASTNEIVRQGLGPIDECQIDKTGRFLVWKTGVEGVGKIEVKILDVQTGGLTDLTDDAPDQAPGHSDNGRGSVVGAANFINAITSRNLATPHVFTKIFDFGDAYDNPFHVSMLADNEDWCLVTFYGEANSGKRTSVLKREVIQIATDGSGRIRRLVHHHSVFRDYYDTPRANISRDGCYVAFTSNWGGGKRRDLFVARIEPAPSITPIRQRRVTP